jgi:hypothetical protein
LLRTCTIDQSLTRNDIFQVLHYTTRTCSALVSIHIHWQPSQNHYRAPKSSRIVKIHWHNPVVRKAMTCQPTVRAKHQDQRVSFGFSRGPEKYVSRMLSASDRPPNPSSSPSTFLRLRFRSPSPHLAKVCILALGVRWWARLLDCLKAAGGTRMRRRMDRECLGRAASLYRVGLLYTQAVSVREISVIRSSHGEEYGE